MCVCLYARKESVRTGANRCEPVRTGANRCASNTGRARCYNANGFTCANSAIGNHHRFLHTLYILVIIVSKCCYPATTFNAKKNNVRPASVICLHGTARYSSDKNIVSGLFGLFSHLAQKSYSNPTTVTSQTKASGLDVQSKPSNRRPKIP